MSKNVTVKPVDIKNPLFEQEYLKMKEKEITRFDPAKMKANSLFKRPVATSRESFRRRV